MPRAKGFGRLAGIAFAALLVAAGTAVAVGLGLQNPGFEDGFDDWTASSVRDAGNDTGGDGEGKPNREVVYGQGGSKGPVVPCAPGDRYGACIVTAPDLFTTGSGQPIAVGTPAGTSMLRLGGPYTNPFQVQEKRHRQRVEQTFTVDPDDPLLWLRYRLFTYEVLGRAHDPGGRDKLRIGLVHTDTGTPLLPRRFRFKNTRFQRGAGNDRDKALRFTGWRGDKLDLSALAGEELTLRVSMVGRDDDDFGSWAYLEPTVKALPPDPPDPPFTPDPPATPEDPDPEPTLPTRPAGSRDTTAPEVEILNERAKTKRKVRIRFRADPDASVRCKLDRRFVKDCTSPVRLKRLGPWKHTFSVDATDDARNRASDSYTFKVKRKNKKGGKGK